jgi:hypothetical protein|tara:strand:+ start:252 stop:689 length:438 start_codon:yes stop_codon:yes gene_type:complete
MSGAGDWGTDKARGKLQSDTPGQNIKRKTEMKNTKIETFKNYSDGVADEAASEVKKLDARTKAFKEKVAKLAYKKSKKLHAEFPKLLDISKIDNPLKGFPYNEKMTKEHTEELMGLLKTASGTDMSHQELMDSMTNWMAAKGYTK